jgi:hypothetical protein
MKAYPVTLALMLVLGAPAAQAQIHVGIELGLPPMPRLVVVSPGIQVVEGFHDEVFLQGGWYWCRRPDGWYRSRSPRARFEWIEGRRVPGGISRMEVGRYRDWHRGNAHPGERGRGPREGGPKREREGRRDERRGEGHRRD